MTPMKRSALTRCLWGMAAMAFLAGIPPGSALASAAALAVFDDFERINATDFLIGTAPDTAHFRGGFSGVAGIPELYLSGSHAWMVNPGHSGEITFETRAAEVAFHARTRSTADDVSILRAFDEQGVQVGEQITLHPGDPFRQVILSGSIARIVFENTASCDTCMNALDDFGFSPVPIPAAAWLFGSSLLALAGFSARQRRGGRCDSGIGW